MQKAYRIGWLTVYMTSEQADRWNMGEFMPDDFATATVIVPGTNRGLPIHDEMSLFAAMENHPEVEEIVNDGYEAELVS